MEVAKKRDLRNPRAIPKEKTRLSEPQHKKGEDLRPIYKPKALLSNAVRFSILFCIAAVSVAGLMVVWRYSSITKEYTKVNALKTEIDVVQTRIKALNVELECAVNINEVQDKAKQWGMTYPTEKQYIKVGEPLPDVSAQDQQPAIDDGG